MSFILPEFQRFLNRIKESQWFFYIVRNNDNLLPKSS